MSLRKPASVNGLVRPGCVEWDAPSSALERWADLPSAAASGDAAEIAIFDQIGETWDGAGFTPKKMAAILRNIGDRPVSIAINSPGGDVFAGRAMAQAMREYPGEITAHVDGVAASAASLLAVTPARCIMAPGSREAVR